LENVGTSDGKAGTPDDWRVKQPRVKCRIQPMSAHERVGLFGGEPTQATHIVFFSDTACGVTEQHRLRFGTRSFRILGVRNADEMNHHLRVEVEETR
jgi:head-tail adaptor